MTNIKQNSKFRKNQFHHNKESGLSQPKWLLAGFVISLLIGFTITWLNVDPTPTSTTAPIPNQPTQVKKPTKTTSYEEQIRIEAPGSIDPAEEIATILSSEAQPMNATPSAESKAPQSKTDKQNIANNEWSADSFLDVIKEPAEVSDSAATIGTLTKQRTVENKDPYLASLVDEAADLSVNPASNSNTVDESSDQALLETTETIVDMGSAPLVFNSDGSITVQRGDSLSKIAYRLYQDGSQYIRIYEANKDVLNGPHKLKIGTRLRIPKS